MKLPELCIKRPVLAVVISLIFILLGILGYLQLTLRDQPKVFKPGIAIRVTAPGSSPQYIEQNIIIPLENNLQAVSYLSYTHSESDQDYAQIDLNFKDITPAQFLTAQSQVQQAVNATNLPDNANTPVIDLRGSNAEQALLISLSDPNMKQHALVDYVANHVVKRLQQVPGVGQVQQMSAIDALRINLSPNNMALLGVSVEEVIAALKNNNSAIQAGQVTNNDQTISINLDAKLTSIDQFKTIIVKHQGNHFIYLKDVATLSIDNVSYTGAYTFYNGMQGVAVRVRAADGANPIALGKHLHTALKHLQNQLPPGMQLHILWNQSKLIQHAVSEVFYTLLESMILVALVTLLFLGNWRFAIIPIVTIPVCMIASFAIMWLFGFSINLMTLLALVLAIGLVIDDAIIVLENSHRYVELGDKPMTATLKSMQQIVFPVIGMTLSIIAVYIPTAFLSGKTAVYFQQFAFTLAGATLISGVIALTLIPMMCARSLKANTKGSYTDKLEYAFLTLTHYYKQSLSWVISHRWLPISLFITLLIAGAIIFKSLPSTMIPKEYAGYVFIGIQAPDSASVAYTARAAKPIIAKIANMPEVAAIMSFGGSTGNSGNFGFNFAKLKPAYTRSVENAKVATKITTMFKHLKNVTVFSSPINVMSHNNGNSPGEINFYITGYANYNQIVTASQSFEKALKELPMFEKVNNNSRYSNQQYNIKVKRQLANELGISIDTINTAIGTYLGGYKFSHGYQFDGVEYPLYLQLAKNGLHDLNALKHIFLTNNQGSPIALSRLVTIDYTTSLPQYIHIDSMRAGAMSVVPKSNYTNGQVISQLEAIAKQILPKDMSLQYDQHTREMLSGNHTIILIFSLGLIFIYLVLAALFESFIDPLIILLTVPLCIVGALTVLKLIGGSLNIYTSIGLITLIGLIAKHGVLITHFANELYKQQNKQQGKSITTAIITAASMRLRPILMTTATMILGAVPLIFSNGVGANSRIQLGTVIIAGLAIGTIFSLFIVPIAYILFASLKIKINQNRKKATQTAVISGP
ncbi:putative efflux pump membrane transporter TtgB [Piscirickettsia salmonis]|uniref:efflux RND transporter permease subunit n=1 Tax=Piscirickettsia salmonis TaxID=1238 RepID=UPI0012B977C9|nr:efflux RND transporter permease subunit [Piscirickettsia salmonis]QGP51933.1 putative efflux pump membrane transporter TtgB [Piscirickettsia salmonis]